MSEANDRPPIGKRISRTSLRPTSLTATELRAVDEFIDLVTVRVGEDLAAIWLYGSRARGEIVSEDSDVDLLVLACGGRERHRRTVLQAALDAERVAGDQRPVVLSTAVVDDGWVADRREIDDFFMADVDRDKVVLFRRH